MATYQLANNETVTKTAADELQFDLSRALGRGDTTARVMTEDLAEVLYLMARAHEYIRRCASNDNEAHKLLKMIEGRTNG